MVSNYITPITKIHSTFSEAKEYFDKYGGISLFDTENNLDVVALAQGKRNLIIGEPGVGKTLLLERIKSHLDNEGFTARLISLRQPNAIEQVSAFLALESKAPKALLLDALDEVKSSAFPSMLQKIEDVSASHPDLSIFLSSRWVFVSRYANSFPEFRFITVSPFTHSQVREYLIGTGHTEADIDALLNRIMSFSHRMLVIQIPRYLFYLDDFLKKKGIEAASQVSRNDLFEHFIYSKLELEEKKLNTNKRDMIKRVLEKLALVMETYQTNVITKDELMTFFDDLKSDLNRTALSQIGIEVFYEYSLLKVSQETLGKIEFENTEFQEYLAAKEITRFPDPVRAAFAFAVDPDANEIYPTWYNALTFLVDMQRNLLEQLVEFSGLRADKFRVLDEAFLTFLSRVDPRGISEKLRRRLFRDVIGYHERTRQWLPGNLANALPAFFDASLESYLKECVERAEKEPESKRFVPLGNISYVVAYLFRAGMRLDRTYWRSNLLSYAIDKNENGVLQRHALLGLQFLGDPSVIDELPDLTESEELIRSEFLSLCTELAPDHPRSLEYFFKAVRQHELHGRYGLFAIRQPSSIKKFLRVFLDDASFRREFMDGTSIFRDRDHVLVENIAGVLDDEARELAKEVLVRSVHYNFAHNAERSAFIAGLWKLLREDDPSFVTDMVERINNSPHGKTSLCFAHGFFAQVIERTDVVPYLKAMLAADEANAAHNVMLRIKFSKREGAEDMYEAGRLLLREEYAGWEETQAKARSSPEEERGEGLICEFRTLLEPEPGKYSQNVFAFYNNHAKDLDPLLTAEDRKRIKELLSGTIFKYIDPGKHGVEITAQHDGSKTYTTSRVISIFGDALVTAKRLGFNVTPYRQQILSHIPFAYNEELTTIFELVKNIQPGEMAPIIEVYRSRHTDLWRHNPSSFVRAVEQYHVVEAVPVLKAFIMEPAWGTYIRREALPVVDSIDPDAEFLWQVFNRFSESDNIDDHTLAHTANGLLVTTHADKDAVQWRLGQILERVAAFTQPRGGHVHSVGDLEDELSFGKQFATPLMKLKYAGFEKDYLGLLDEAMKIWARGEEFYAYSIYMWEIVYAYFDNLKERQSYTPLQQLEDQVARMQDREGANWLLGRMANLRHSYLVYLGKLDNISKAIAKYNDTRAYDDKQIRNSTDLFRHVQEAFNVELRQWIEGEGAYNVLGYKIAEAGRQEYEKLVQKTLKTQVENVLLRRGFQVEVLREPQLLDEKRTDLLVRYGFAGPIVVEVKLTSNKDIQGRRIEQSASYASMGQYMQGYGAMHGLFMVIDNIGVRNIPQITEAFHKIKGVEVLSFNSHKTFSSGTKSSKRAKNSPVRAKRTNRNGKD